MGTLGRALGFAPVAGRGTVAGGAAVEVNGAAGKLLAKFSGGFDALGDWGMGGSLVG